MKGGVIADPNPTPAKINPFARPRSCEGIHAATRRLLAGYTIDSPTPNKKRTATKTAREAAIFAGTNAVSAVNTAHHSVPKKRILLGPKRSARRPLGAWNNAYPTTQALKTQPS